jgi:ABC-type uncharacterized transport system auxiliary subunit
MLKKMTWVGIVSAGLFLGCGAAHPSSYYHLTIPAHPPAADPPPFPVTLLIGPLRASHLYREDHIVYSSKTESMGTYQYQRWGEPPTEMLQDMLLRELRSSERYRGVDMLRSNSRGDYILSGRLYDFEEISVSPLSARISLDVELHEVKTGATIWRHSCVHDEPAAGKTMPAVVAALDRNAQRCLGEITSGLDQYFSSHPPN